jgi:tetratricopeptide (TPR) repeat protein
MILNALPLARALATATGMLMMSSTIYGQGRAPETAAELSVPANPEFIHPADIFLTPEFVESFIGSYGVLPGVEPKLSEDENNLMGQVAEVMGKDDAAAIGYIGGFLKRASAEKKGASAALFFILGNLYLNQEKLDKAIQAYKAAIQIFPDFRRAHKNLGLLLAREQKYTDALPHLRKSVELGEATAQTYGLLGYCYVSTADFLAAESAYRQAFLMDSDNPDWRGGLVQALVELKKYQEASAMLRIMIEENPSDPNLWKMQGNTFIGLNEPMKAAENFEILRHMGKADAQTLILLGDIYSTKELMVPALGAYLRAVEAGTGLDVQRSLRTADIFLRNGAPEQAQTFVAGVKQKSELVGISVKDRLALRTLEAKIARQLGNEKQAVEILQEIVKEDTRNMAARIELGEYFGKNDETAKAVLQFEFAESTARSTDNTAMLHLAMLRHGQMLVRMEKYSAGLPLLNKAYELKKSEVLERFIARVEHAADRQRIRESARDTIIKESPPPTAEVANPVQPG